MLATVRKTEGSSQSGEGLLLDNNLQRNLWWRRKRGQERQNRLKAKRE